MNKEYVIAAYLRVSLEEQNIDKIESNSISNQRLLIQKYIKAQKDLQNAVLMEILDDGYSGINFERPGIKKLLKWIKEKKIDGIIVKDISRFGRNYIEVGNYLEYVFPFLKIRFIAVEEGYDSFASNAKDNIGIVFKNIFSELYSRDLSQKVKSSFTVKCRSGNYIFSQLPMGYKKIEGSSNKITINKEEGKIVQYIFKMAFEKMTTTQIAKKLNEEHIPTCFQLRNKWKYKDKQPCWTSSIVRNILKNRFYIGEWTFYKTQREIGSKKSRRTQEEELVTFSNHHEKLVDRNTFFAVQLSKKNISSQYKYKQHSLTGKLICANCGYKMVYKKHTKYQHFECIRNSIFSGNCCTYYSEKILKQTILTILEKGFFQLIDLKKIETIFLKKLKKEERKKKTEKRRLELKKQQNYEKYINCKISEEDYKKLVQIIEEKIDKIEIELIENNNLKELKNLTQQLIKNFIKTILVYKKKQIQIRFTFSFDTIITHKGYGILDAYGAFESLSLNL